MWNKIWVPDLIAAITANAADELSAQIVMVH